VDLVLHNVHKEKKPIKHTFLNHLKVQIMDHPVPRQLKPVIDSKRKIVIDFTVRLAENDLAPEQLESHPRASIFLSDHFERDIETGGIVNVHMDDENPRHVYQGYVVGTLKREYASVPPEASLSIYLYAIHQNDHGHPCWVEVGTNHIPLHSIKNKNHIVMMEMLVRTIVVSGLDPLRKALLELNIRNIQLPPGIAYASDALEQPLDKVETMVSEYVRKTVQIDESLRDTFKNTERMRAPYTLSPAGIESTGNTFLPVAAFASFVTPRANEAFYLNALDKIMNRHGLTVNDYMELNLEQRARMTASVCTYGIQTFDYISDTVELQNRRNKADTQRNRIDTDSWSDITRTCSGDCEDSCRGCQVMKKGLMSIKAVHPAVVDMQRITRNYIMLQALTVVHGQKIGDEEGYGAHLCDIFLPVEHANKMLTHTSAGRSLLKRTGPVKTLPVDARVDNKYGDNWPVLICEGTGVIDPLGNTVDPLAQERRYVVENMPTSACFKREIPHIRGQPSSFYHGFLLAITDHWIDYGVGALIIGTKCTDGAAEEMTRGALYTDMMEGRVDRIALMPQPRIPESVSRVAKAAISLSPPPRPLVISEPLEPERRDPLLDRLCDGINSFNRPKPAKKPVGSIDLYVRAHQYDDDRIGQLLNEARSMDRLYAADYVEERFTDHVTCHRVRLWIK